MSTCCSGLGNVKTNHTQLLSGLEAVIPRAGQAPKTRAVFLPVSKVWQGLLRSKAGSPSAGTKHGSEGCGRADKRAPLTAHAEAEPPHVRRVCGRLRSAHKVRRRKVCSGPIDVAVSLPSEAARKVRDGRVCFPGQRPRADAECLQPEYATRARVSPPPLASGRHRAVTASRALPSAYPSALTPCRPGTARLPEAARSPLSPTRRRQVWSCRPARPGAQTWRRRLPAERRYPLGPRGLPPLRAACAGRSPPRRSQTQLPTLAAAVGGT